MLATFLLACFGPLNRSATLAQDIKVSAELKLKTGTPEGILTVTAIIPDGYHTYSLTQPEGGPTRSTLELEGTGIQQIGGFVSQPEPERHDEEYLGPVEEHRGVIIWSARVQVSPAVDPAKLETRINLHAQVCTDLTDICNPPTTYSGQIEFAGERDNLIPLPIPSSLPAKKRAAPQAGDSDTQFFKLTEADTPEQIVAMANLYDANEPIKYINFSDMNKYPVGPDDSEPIKQIPILLVVQVVFIFGAIASLMVYMLFNRSIENTETAKKSGDDPVYPRMRQIAFAACLIFSLGILVVGLLVIAEIKPWQSSDEAAQLAIATPSTDPIAWANWHPGKVNQQLNQNKMVWVNYTAAWDMLSKINEARVASNGELLERMRELDMSFVAVDFTQKDDNKMQELARSDTYSIPVNLIYPPNYPDEPAVKLETVLTATDIHLVLDRMEAIVSELGK